MRTTLKAWYNALSLQRRGPPRTTAWFPPPGGPYGFFDGVHYHQKNFPFTWDEIYCSTYVKAKEEVIKVVFQEDFFFEFLQQQRKP